MPQISLEQHRVAASQNFLLTIHRLCQPLTTTVSDRKFVIEPMELYFQDAAGDLLREGLRAEKYESGLQAYLYLCAVAHKTEADPGPDDRDGKPFNVSIDQIAFAVDQTPAITRAYLADFVRLGLIDEVAIPQNDLQAFTVRLCLLEVFCFKLLPVTGGEA